MVVWIQFCIFAFRIIVLLIKCKAGQNIELCSFLNRYLSKTKWLQLVCFQGEEKSKMSARMRSDFFPIPVSSRHRLINSLTDCEDSLFPNLFMKKHSEGANRRWYCLSIFNTSTEQICMTRSLLPFPKTLIVACFKSTASHDNSHNSETRIPVANKSSTTAISLVCAL